MPRHRARPTASRTKRTKRLKTCASRGSVPAKQRASPRKTSSPRLRGSARDFPLLPLHSQAKEAETPENTRFHGAPHFHKPYLSVICYLSKCTNKSITICNATDIYRGFLFCINEPNPSFQSTEVELPTNEVHTFLIKSANDHGKFSSRKNSIGSNAYA